MNLRDRALSIVAAAEEAPGRPAVITATRSWTFAELAAAVAAVDLPRDTAHARPLIATPDVATIIQILAALERGQPFAPLHARGTSAEHAGVVAELAARPVPANTLAVVFTSGSTGRPRGVVLSRAGFLASAAASAQHLGWRDDDRWLACLPLAHVGGLAVVLRCLVARRPVVLHEGGFAAPAVAALTAQAGVTLASLVPTQLAALLDDAGWRPPASLRAVLLGGAATPRPVLEAAARRGVPFLRTYGMTETWGQVCTQPLATAGKIRDGVGVALAGVTIEAGTPSAPAPIRIASPTAMTGYLEEGSRLQASGSRFRNGAGPSASDPEPGARSLEPGAQPSSMWIPTSDLGYLDDDGDLHVIGRADDVIITGGENVHPAAVEDAIAAYPGVGAAVAFGVADPRWGQLVAVAITVADRGSFDRADLAAFLSSRLAPHQRPRRLAVLAVLPLGPSGKVDRTATAALATPALAEL